MSYLSDWKEAEEAAAAARAANPLCDESKTCPAPDDGHLLGCRSQRRYSEGAKGQLEWMEEMDKIAQEELGARPRGEVIVELTETNCPRCGGAYADDNDTTHECPPGFRE